MPSRRTRKEQDKIEELIRFMRYTWEVVRRNPEYQSDYDKFLKNSGLTREELKDPLPSGMYPLPPRKMFYDENTTCWVFEDALPDPERCNHAYMLSRWGFIGDPDNDTPSAEAWSTFASSKNWRTIKTLTGNAFINAELVEKTKDLLPGLSQPLGFADVNFKTLPGVMKVDKWPKVKYAGEHNWNIESPPNLTITINLIAPTEFIGEFLKSLIAYAKAQLDIKDKKIEWEYIAKCLKAWDLRRKGVPDKKIAKSVSPIKYRSKDRRKKDPRTPEMIQADNEIDAEDLMISQINSYVRKADDIINKGAII